MPNVAIILAEEGPQQSLFNGYNDSSRALKERGITLMSVGVGGRVNQYELQRIVTNPEHALLANTLDDAISSIANVANATCLAKPTPPQGKHIIISLVSVKNFVAPQNMNYFYHSHISLFFVLQ